jgi:hypothetical protein
MDGRARQPLSFRNSCLSITINRGPDVLFPLAYSERMEFWRNIIDTVADYFFLLDTTLLLYHEHSNGLSSDL